MRRSAIAGRPRANRPPISPTTSAEPAACGHHAEGIGPGGAPTVAVQVATIEDADPDVLARSIHYVDGRHDAFDRPPADTRLL